MEIVISILLGLFVIFAGLFYFIFLDKEFKKYVIKDNDNNMEKK